MTWAEVGKLVIDVAPLVAGGLAGPSAAGAVRVLAGLFGLTKDNPTPEELATIIRQDPEMNLKLKQADYAFLMEMRRQDKEELALVLGDTQNARGREAAIVAKTGRLDYNLYVTAWVVISGFFLLLAVMMFRPLDPQSVGPVNQLMGALSTGFGVVLSYFFGSSLGSFKKTQEISRLSNGGTNPPKTS